MSEGVQISSASLLRYRRQLEQKLAILTGVPAQGGGRVAGSGQLAEVERALMAITDGTYGICAGCGEPIGALRLKMVPETRLCLLCAYP